MSVKVTGWLQDGGDGSTSVSWVKEQDAEQWGLYVESNSAYDYFHDGDGDTDRIHLVFDSYEAAEAVGIKFSCIPDFEEEEEEED